VTNNSPIGAEVPAGTTAAMSDYRRNVRRMSSERVVTAVAALCLVQFVDVMGVTVVVAALPDMLAAVGADASSGGYVATGYAMFFGGLLMFGARLGDRIGHRRTILVSLVLFTVGSIQAAVATSILVLTAARCVQGAAAACAVPSALRLLTSVTAPGPMRQRAVAAWSAAGAAAGASGFVVGGIVTDLANWRYIFWGYVLVAVALGLAIVRAVPTDGTGDPTRQFAVAASTVLTATVMAVVVGATEIAEPAGRWLGAALLVAGVVGASALRALDRRSSAPLLPAPLLRQGHLRRGAVGSFVNTATLSSVATLVTLYLQDNLGRSPLSAAAIFVPLSLAGIAGSALAAPALQRAHRETVCALGLGSIAVGDLGLILVAGHVVALSGCLALGGLGIGLSSVAATSLGTDVDEADRAAASGIINTAAQVGTAVGIAIILLIAAATTSSLDTDTPRIAWGVAGAVAALSAVWFAALRRAPR
jgi:MFS family permease